MMKLVCISNAGLRKGIPRGGTGTEALGRRRRLGEGKVRSCAAGYRSCQKLRTLSQGRWGAQINNHSLAGPLGRGKNFGLDLESIEKTEDNEARGDLIISAPLAKGEAV
jgi:hypothetical protein